MSGILTTVVGLVLKLAASGTVEEVLAYLREKSRQETGEAQLRTQVTIKAIEAAIEERRIQARLQYRKLDFRLFWVFCALFILPLAGWWWAVILDSMFLFSWSVAKLPAPLGDWAAEMIAWIFGGATTVGVAAGLQTVLGRGR